jgi:hypothetical protein
MVVLDFVRRAGGLPAESQGLIRALPLINSNDIVTNSQLEMCFIAVMEFP